MRKTFSITFLLLLSLSVFAQESYPIKVNKKWGLINADGKVIIDPIYEAIGEFKQFGYAVMQREGNVGMLNSKGDEVILPQYDDLKVLDSTLIAVMKNEEWKVVNLDGKVILKKVMKELECGKVVF